MQRGGEKVSIASSHKYMRGCLRAGKLRIDARYRRLGLHIRAALMFYGSKQIRHPCTNYHFVSIASLFNFVSMAKQVGTWQWLTGSSGSGGGDSKSSGDGVSKLLDQVLISMCDEEKYGGVCLCSPCRAVSSGADKRVMLMW